MTEKEVAVFIVFGTLNFECSTLSIGINHQIVSPSSLGGGDSSDIELPKLHFRLDTKEVLGTLDESVLDG